MDKIKKLLILINLSLQFISLNSQTAFGDISNNGLVPLQKPYYPPVNTTPLYPAPGFALPNSWVPGATIPGTEVPGTVLPGVTTPDFTAPGIVYPPNEILPSSVNTEEQMRRNPAIPY